MVIRYNFLHSRLHAESHWRRWRRGAVRARARGAAGCRALLPRAACRGAERVAFRAYAEISSAARRHSVVAVAKPSRLRRGGQWQPGCPWQRAEKVIAGRRREEGHPPVPCAPVIEGMRMVMSPRVIYVVERDVHARLSPETDIPRGAEYYGPLRLSYYVVMFRLPSSV